MLRRLLSLALLSLALAAPAAGAGLLPNGKQTFLKATGVPCASCSIYFYIPQTTTPKDTWQDADRSVLNTNPIITDSAGTAVIYGSGTYRQIFKDETGTTIWDQPTADPVSLNAGWGGLSGGSANAQTITVSNYSAADGQAVSFLAQFSNSGAMTLNVNSLGAVAVVKDTSTGPQALGGGEVISGNVVGAIYSTTTGQFHIITPTPTLSFDGALYFNGFITPTILAADQDDWTPSGGFTGANTVRVSSSAAINVTGLAGGTAGRQVAFHNSGSFPITFVTQSTSSAAANRFLFSNSIVLNPNDGVTVQYDALSSRWRGPSAPAPLYPPNFISGCTLSNNASDATNDIDITACNVRATGSATNINVAALTKRLDADWAAGTNQGMRYSGAAIANTTYHIFAISTASGTADIFAYDGTDPTSVLPSGYVNYRMIMSIVRAAAAISLFHQYNNEVSFDNPTGDFSSAAGVTTAVTRTLTSLPTGIKVQAILEAQLVAATTGAGFSYFSSLDSTDSAAAATNATVIASSNSANGYTAIVRLWTNTSAQIRTRTSITGGGDVTRGTTLGFVHPRGATS